MLALQSILLVQIEEVMAENNLCLKIHNDNQECVDAASPYEDLVEAIVCIPIDVINVADTQSGKVREFEAVDIRPDV